MYDKLKFFLRVNIAAFDVMKQTAEVFGKKQSTKQLKIKYLSSNLLDEINRIPNDVNQINIKIARLERAMGNKIPNDIL